jgi:hypothetical protein
MEAERVFYCFFCIDRLENDDWDAVFNRLKDKEGMVWVNENEHRLLFHFLNSEYVTAKQKNKWKRKVRSIIFKNSQK